MDQQLDRLRFEGRAGARGGGAASARAGVEPVAAPARRRGELARRSVRLGETDRGIPATLVRDALTAELGRDTAVAGVPWGADMRLWTARGIPTVMAGTPGIELAHGVDERVRVEDLVTLARAIVRVGLEFAPPAPTPGPATKGATPWA